ncbi:hypothetical protein [Histidinibacterium lentulum]|nr:hypothetical protein [Histidinibacterium lentulum]
MQQDPFIQSTEARLAALRHQMRSAERTTRLEQSRAVPDLATLQQLAADRRHLSEEIQRYEGILRTLARTVSPFGAPGRRGG